MNINQKLLFVEENYFNSKNIYFSQNAIQIGNSTSSDKNLNFENSLDSAEKTALKFSVTVTDEIIFKKKNTILMACKSSIWIANECGNNQQYNQKARETATACIWNFLEIEVLTAQEILITFSH